MSFNITSVYKYNIAFARLYMPVIVLLVVLMAVGVVGNSLVCYVYYVKFKPCNNRCFIVAMGILDLFTCVVSIPLHILELNYSATFGTFGLCESILTCVTFFSMSSAAVLVVVAVDRYRKICQPFKRQMTPYSAKILSVVCCVVSALFSIPSSVIDGPTTISLGEINATICSQRDDDSDLQIVHSGIQMFLFVGALMSLVVLYGLIWQQVRRKQTIRRRFSECQNPNNTLKPCLTGQTNSARRSDDECCQPINCDTTQEGEKSNAKPLVRREPNNDTHLNLIQNNVKCESGSQSRSDQTVITHCLGQASSPSFMPTLSIPRRTPTPAHSLGKHGTGKITMVLFLITLVFILSYLPYLALTVVRSTHPDILDETLVAGAILERSYFIQCISNPLIYSFCNAKFRQHIRSMCRKSI